eukprot:m.62355 g.62355  ORF g.62355 m.62355 type:complete len:1613 (+) comp11505_c0_seq1:321-5159(+)
MDKLGAPLTSTTPGVGGVDVERWADQASGRTERDDSEGRYGRPIPAFPSGRPRKNSNSQNDIPYGQPSPIDTGGYRRGSSGSVDISQYGQRTPRSGSGSILPSPVRRTSSEISDPLLSALKGNHFFPPHDNTHTNDPSYVGPATPPSPKPGVYAPLDSRNVEEILSPILRSNSGKSNSQQHYTEQETSGDTAVVTSGSTITDAHTIKPDESCPIPLKQHFEKLEQSTSTDKLNPTDEHQQQAPKENVDSASFAKRNVANSNVNNTDDEDSVNVVMDSSSENRECDPEDEDVPNSEIVEDLSNHPNTSRHSEASMDLDHTIIAWNKQDLKKEIKALLRAHEFDLTQSPFTDDKEDVVVDALLKLADGYSSSLKADFDLTLDCIGEIQNSAISRLSRRMSSYESNESQNFASTSELDALIEEEGLTAQDNIDDLMVVGDPTKEEAPVRDEITLSPTPTPGALQREEFEKEMTQVDLISSKEQVDPKDNLSISHSGDNGTERELDDPRSSSSSDSIEFGFQENFSPSPANNTQTNIPAQQTNQTDILPRDKQPPEIPPRSNIPASSKALYVPRESPPTSLVSHSESGRQQQSSTSQVSSSDNQGLMGAQTSVGSVKLEEQRSSEMPKVVIRNRSATVTASPQRRERKDAHTQSLLSPSVSKGSGGLRNTGAPLTTHQRTRNIIAEEGWLEVSIMLYIHGAKLKVTPTKCNPKKHWAILRGQQLTFESKKSGKVEASIEGCVGHRLNTSICKSLGYVKNPCFALAVRVGQVSLPNYVYLIGASSEREANNWLQAIHKAAGMFEALSTNPQQSITKLSAKAAEAKRLIDVKREKSLTCEAEWLEWFRFKNYLQAFKMPTPVSADEGCSLSPSCLSIEMRQEMTNIGIGQAAHTASALILFLHLSLIHRPRRRRSLFLSNSTSGKKSPLQSSVRVFLPDSVKQQNPVIIKKEGRMTAKLLMEHAAKKFKMPTSTTYTYYLRSHETLNGNHNIRFYQDDDVLEEDTSQFPQYDMVPKPHFSFHMSCGDASEYGLVVKAVQLETHKIVEVFGLVPGGIAERTGLEVGDEILSVNNEKGSDEYGLIVTQLQDCPKVELEVRRHRVIGVTVNSEVRRKIDAFIHENACHEFPESKVIARSKTATQASTQLEYLVDELVDTEISYCSLLEDLATRYISPILKSETISPNEKRMLNNFLPEVLEFQKDFARKLIHIVDDPDEELNELVAPPPAPIPPPRSRASLQSVGRLENSTIEESVYDTLRLIQSWERPEAPSSLQPPTAGSTRRKVTSRRVPSQYHGSNSDDIVERSEVSQDNAGLVSVAASNVPIVTVNNSEPETAMKETSALMKRLNAIAQLFVDKLLNFLVYCEYSAWNFSAVRILLDKSSEKHSVRVLCEQLNPTMVSTKAINAMLIVPIQRVLKYPLLLQNMHRQLSRQENPDAPSETLVTLSNALSGMTDLASEINDVARLTETFEPVLRQKFPGFQSGKEFGKLHFCESVQWLNCEKKSLRTLYMLIFPSFVVFFQIRPGKQKFSVHDVIPSVKFHYILDPPKEFSKFVAAAEVKPFVLYHVQGPNVNPKAYLIMCATDDKREKLCEILDHVKKEEAIVPAWYGIDPVETIQL